MQSVSIQQNPLYHQALNALQSGNPGSAKQLFLQLRETYDNDVSVYLGLAVACNQSGESDACFDALDCALVIEPNNLTVLLMKGDLLHAQGKKRLANHCYGIAIGVAENTAELPADLSSAIKRVSRIRNEINGQIETHILSKIDYQLSDEQQRSRFLLSLDLLNGSKTLYPQKPRAYYFPELPLKQFYSRSQFEWVEQIEAATESICEELANLIQQQAKFEPYIKRAEQGPAGHINPLLDKLDWSAFFLIKDGQVVEDNARLCPCTMQAISNIPLPDIKGRAPMVLFSLLKPGTRIAPHHGFLNTRLICHLPLVIPAQCGLRVGNQVHEWQKGEVVIFDDSIEHEAWNNSEENRVVLIFDIWRPELTEQERAWVRQLLEAIDTFE